MSFNRILILPILLIFGIASVNANPKADSLLLQLKKAKDDTIKIRIYNELSSNYTKIKPDTALYYVNKAIELSNNILKTGDEETKQVVNILLAQSYSNLGHYYKALDDNELATKSFKKSLELRKSSEDLKGMAITYIDLGSIQTLKGNYDIAADYCNKAIEIQDKIKDDVGLARAYLNIGNVYYYQGDYDLASDNYQKSLRLSEKINDLESVSKCCNNIGKIY